MEQRTKSSGAHSNGSTSTSSYSTPVTTGETKSSTSSRIPSGTSSATSTSLMEPIDYRTLHTSIQNPPPVQLEPLVVPGGVHNSMAYVTEGGLDAGRWPHPTTEMRADSPGEKTIMKRLCANGGIRTTPQGTKPGHYPSTETAPIIGPALGPRLNGVDGASNLNVDRGWWCDQDNSAVFDDVAEAHCQERLLKTLFPDMFWGKKAKPNRHKRLNSKGYYFLSQGITLAMTERFTQGRDTEDALFYGAGYGWNESRGSRRELLLEANRTRNECNKKLAAAGFEENLWLTSLDAKKMNLARHAIDVYNGDIKTNGSRVIRSKGHQGYEGYKKYLAELKSLKVGQMLWEGAGWAGETAGHCVVRITEKTGPDTIAMTMCNSGQGLGNHAGVSVLNSPGPIDNFPRGKSIW
jgi:hypothetical protein